MITGGHMWKEGPCLCSKMVDVNLTLELSPVIHFIKQAVSTYHKPFNTSKSLLVYPEDRTLPERKTGVV